MAKFFLPLCLLALLLHGTTAQFGFSPSPWQSSRQGARSQCRFERLSALEPKRHVQSEGGVTEYFEDNNEQLECAGVAAIRMTIKPQGLSLPTYFNAPHLIYIIKGRGIGGGLIPGCPETYQSSGQRQQQHGEQQQGQQQQQKGEKQEGQQEQQGQQQKQQGEEQQEGQQGQGQRTTGDQHQRILRFRQGDILAVPAGMAHWWYNDGDSPIVMVMVLDTSSNANQLDSNPRKFSLAGETSEQDRKSANIFRGFNLQFLADALGVSQELTKKLQQGQDGEMVRVQRGLRVVMPPTSEREEQREESEGSEVQNGLEQTFCTMKRRENIGKPSHADAYIPQVGWYARLNGQKLPILNFIQMSASRGVLYRSLCLNSSRTGVTSLICMMQGATIAPHWNINAHDILYVTKGRGRIQIVGNQGRSVFNDELREGQMVVIPQHFAVMMQAKDEQFEWVGFLTHGNPVASKIVGSGSFFRGLPDDVIAESYKGMSRGEARILKNQVSFHQSSSQQEKGGKLS